MFEWMPMETKGGVRSTAGAWTHTDPYRSYQESQLPWQTWGNKFPVVYLCQTHLGSSKQSSGERERERESESAERESTNSWWVFIFSSGVRGVSELPWSWSKMPLPWPLITVGIINKLITQGLFVFSFVFACKGGGCGVQKATGMWMENGWVCVWKG